MASDKRLRLIGATPSPYSRKMIGLLRYRHIPYQILWGQIEAILDSLAIEKPKKLLYPTFLFDGENDTPKAVCDSTPIIRTLEDMYKGRSVLPVNPVIAFLDYLLEDFGDEWISRYMFHYRWHFPEDADNASTQIPLSSMVNMPPATLVQVKDYFSKRQISRLPVVGSCDTTAPMIEASYKRYLDAMEKHLSVQPFLLGNRPAASDFAAYGQLTQLIGIDPTSRALAHNISPRTVAWTAMMEDNSGVEPKSHDWNDPSSIPETLRGILTEVGRTYTPITLANAKALMAGEKSFELEIEGVTWQQQTVMYQAKCLRWINDEFIKLTDSDQKSVLDILDGTGCEKILFDL